MEGQQESLSKRLSGLLAALRKSSSSKQVDSSGTTSSHASSEPQKDVSKAAKSATHSPIPERTTVSNAQQKTSDLDIETLPDLLEFLKTTSNPKLLRAVVTRFLENPLLSENDRNLVKKKVQEKIEEEKRRKEAKKSVTGTESPARSEVSSRAQEVSENSTPGITPKLDLSGVEQFIGAITQPTNSVNPSVPFIDAQLNPTGLTPEDEANYNAQLIANLLEQREKGNVEGSEYTHNEWATTAAVPDDASLPFAASANAGQIPVIGQVPVGSMPLQNPVLFPNASFSAPPPMNQFSVPPPQFPHIHPIPGVMSVPPPVSFQVPPPSAVAGNLPLNHGAAGFANREMLTTPAGVAVTIEYGKNAVKPPSAVITKAEIVYERDIIPRTPTPPPTPPPNPLLRSGAMVPALSANGRLIMPGATLAKQRIPSPALDYENLYYEENRSGKATEGRGTKRVAEVTNTKSAESVSSVPRMSLFETLSSENVGRSCYIRQYSVRHNISFEEAERILEEEESEFVGTRRQKKRRTDVYTKGFVPLVKQKCAKNIDEYGRPVDTAYDEPYDYDYPPADAAYDEAYEDTQSEWRRPPHRTSHEEFAEPREYEEGEYVEPAYYRRDVAGDSHDYCEPEYGNDDYERYGSESSLERRRRRKRGGKKHRAKLERTGAFQGRRSR